MPRRLPKHWSNLLGVVGKVGRCHNLRLLPPLKPFKGHRKKTIAGGDVGWKKWRNAPFFSTRGRKCRKRWTVQHVFKNVSEKIKRAGVFNIAKPGFCEVSWVSIKVGGWRQRWWWRQRAGREHFMIKISTNGSQMLVIYHSRTSRKKREIPKLPINRWLVVFEDMFDKKIERVDTLPKGTLF